jgi:hypothetical protein
MTAYAAIFPLIDAREGIEKKRLAVQKDLEALAKGLPALGYIVGVRGVGIGSFAGVIGEAGDLSGYSNPAKLWKRMGMAVIEGGRQRKVASREGAEKHGYVPARRSVMFVIGECILKAQVRKVKDDAGKDTGARSAIGPLGQLYLDRKVFELIKCEAIAADPEQTAKFGGENYAPALHAHKRAQRYIEKRFLRDLWAAWNGRGGQCSAETHTSGAAAAE